MYICTTITTKKFQLIFPYMLLLNLQVIKGQLVT